MSSSFLYPEACSWIPLTQMDKPIELVLSQFAYRLNFVAREDPESQWKDFKFILTWNREDGDVGIHHWEDVPRVPSGTLVETVTLNDGQVTTVPMEGM